MLKTISLLILLLSNLANADVSLSFGAGKNILGNSHENFEKVGIIGYQSEFSNDLFIKPEVGFFTGNGESFWISPLVGVEILSLIGQEIHFAIGPAYLQNTDSILGGHFQFVLEAGAGITDGIFYLGLAWNHISDAGLVLPNQGRDFITLQLRILEL